SKIDGGAAGLTNLGSITLTGSFEKRLANVINNQGTIHHAGSGWLTNYDHGTLNNLPGAVYDLQGDAGIAIDAFVNRGTLRKSSGTGTSKMAAATFSNDGGIIDVQQGTVLLASRKGSHTGGTFKVAEDAVLDLTPDFGVNLLTYIGVYTGSGQG